MDGSLVITSRGRGDGERAGDALRRTPTRQRARHQAGTEGDTRSAETRGVVSG